MKIVAIADVHNKAEYLKLPEGDTLVVAGDMTLEGKDYEVEDFARRAKLWDFKHKVAIAGNHDFLFQRHPKKARVMMEYAGFHYLEDEEVILDGVKFYGTPWQPWFYDWAFNVPRGQLKPYWDKIPHGLDVLITHGPPMGILDQAAPHKNSEHIGCQELMDAINEKKPKISIFGHIHGGYGYKYFNGTHFYNAAVVDEAYRLRNEPWVFEV